MQYSEIQGAPFETYNLAFGDFDDENAEIDDAIVTNNGDAKKVIATVIATIYDFTRTYPKSQIYFRGSNKARTRAYAKIIHDYYDILIKDFYIFGLKYAPSNEDAPELPFLYEKSDRYSYVAFIVRRREEFEPNSEKKHLVE